MKMKMSWILATRAYTLTVLVGALALAGCNKSETASDGAADPVAATDVESRWMVVCRAWSARRGMRAV